MKSRCVTFQINRILNAFFLSSLSLFPSEISSVKLKQSKTIKVRCFLISFQIVEISSNSSFSFSRRLRRSTLYLFPLCLHCQQRFPRASPTVRRREKKRYFISSARYLRPSNPVQGKRIRACANAIVAIPYVGMYRNIQLERHVHFIAHSYDRWPDRIDRPGIVSFPSSVLPTIHSRLIFTLRFKKIPRVQRSFDSNNLRVKKSSTFRSRSSPLWSSDANQISC